MTIIDDQPPIDPKKELLKEELPKLLLEANKLISFRVFRTKKGWENQDYSVIKWMRNWMVTVIGLANAIEEVRNRHTKEVWDRYTTLGIKGLAEQILLNKRTQDLEVFLNKNKPPYIIKGKPSKTAKVTYNGPTITTDQA